MGVRVVNASDTTVKYSGGILRLWTGFKAMVAQELFGSCTKPIIL